MSNNTESTLLSSSPEKLARLFKRYGWVGFWLQVVLAASAILLVINVLFFSHAAAIQRQGIGLAIYLALIAFLILIFTIFWFYRYTRLARKIADPQRRPPKSSVIRTLWVGIWASCFGIAFSMIAMFLEVGRLLRVFMRAPQGGIPVIQTEYDPSTWISAVDMVSLLADLSVLAGELIVLTFSLWLLLRVSMAASYDRTSKESEA